MMPLRQTIALADDDVLQAELLAMFLEQQGYDVHRFDTGDDLVAWAAESSANVDAFLLDVDMPGRNGFESCQALRGLRIYAGTPTLFVSSMNAADLDDKVRAAGGNGMMRKDATLLPRLAEWLAENLGTAV
jgi:DNA-binding response OmpR family regulator